jgi:hypothetical protein
MALNTDYAIRTGAFDPVQISKNTSAPKPLSEDELKQKAFERYQKAKVLLVCFLSFVVVRTFVVVR